MFEEFNKRSQYKDDPSKLPIIMKTVNWCSVEMRHYAIQSLNEWAPIRDAHALSLLQHEIADSEVRKYAVRKLNKVSNRLLANFMPQLVQALKFEAHHSSSLGDMLIMRALKSPRIVGHALFWALNASLYDQYTFERLYLHYERFLFLCPHYRTEIYFQTRVNDAIIDTNYMAVNNPNITMEELMDRANDRINEIKLELGFDYFVLPHIPYIPIESIVKLRALPSKQKPILLTCEVFTGRKEDRKMSDMVEQPKAKSTLDTTIRVLFKKGDDLRKDQVVLQ